MSDISDVFCLVAQERRRQLDKWGEQHHEDPLWLAILGEEFGELSAAILHENWPDDERQKSKESLQELIHVAAVAVGWLEHKLGQEERESDE